MTKKRDRLLPGFFPQWIHRRVEVENYVLYNFMERVGASLLPGTVLLDAGAGERRYYEELAHTRYVGVDLAVGDAGWDYSHLDAICTLVHLPFGDQTFDAIVCTQVLEHVPEPARVLRETCRVLKPAGQLFVSVPQSWAQHQKPHDYYRYTSYGLRYLIQQAGLEVREIQNMGGYFWFLSLQLQNVNFWLFPKGMRARWLTWPLRAILGVLFQLFLPLLLFYMDRFDRLKDETFGYVVIASKPQSRV